MNKQKSHAFGKDTYLLGVDKDGCYLWLEAASWDCDWYWGFGYVEVYTNQKQPHKAKDIASHQHFDGLVRQVGHINEVLKESVLSKSESWELADLMKTFYTLKDAAAFYTRGHSGLSSIACTGEFFEDMAKQINQRDIPMLFERIYEILTPAVEG